MDKVVIRPSMKLIRVGYTVVFTIIFICVLIYTNNSKIGETTPWILAIPALLLLWPLRYHLQRRFTTMTISADKLSYETGMLSRSKRVIQVTKVQDVRINQTLPQRMLHVGDLSIETAGETSSLTMRNVDDPDRLTETILEAAHEHADQGKDRRTKS